MSKGRKKTPANLKVLKGTYRKDRDNETTGSGSPVMVPPYFLSCRAKEIFNGLYQKIKAMSYSDNSHSDMLGLLALTLEEVELLTETLKDKSLSYETISTAGEKVHKARPEVKQRADAIRRSQSLLSEFGLSATAQGKIAFKKTQKTDNPFDEFQ